ncbi:hypothetical protein DID88_008010 [Monilinia fructigena]|uniref:Uncharacterized protein n=1 Tax=Monilinia fructigena TaxID=38457 RepID=A0A395J4G5_9HELO|nr:hypothetical protein DID88_008010 [Monilinia fructigena]
MPTTRSQDKRNTLRSNAQMAKRGAAATKEDTSSAAMLNGVMNNSRTRHKQATKQAIKHPQRPVPERPEYRADFEEEEEEEEEEALQAPLLANQSGLDAENMTAELETHQPQSPVRRKSTERSPTQSRQEVKNKRKRKAQDSLEPQNSSQKRKRDRTYILCLAPQKTKPILKGNSETKPKPAINPIKRGRGCPRKVVHDQVISQDEPVARANDEPEEEVENSDVELPDLQNIGKVVPKRIQQIPEDDGDETINHPLSAQTTNEDIDKGGVEDDGEHADLGENVAEDEGGGSKIYDILQSPSPVKVHLPMTREQYQESGRNAKKVSGNYANGIYKNGVRPPQGYPGHRESAAKEAREVSEVEDDQIYEKLAAWGGIIDDQFFPKIRTILNRLGCIESRGTWKAKAEISRKILSASGKKMERCLNKLLEHYQKISKHAIDEDNEPIKPKLNQTLTELLMS